MSDNYIFPMEPASLDRFAHDETEERLYHVWKRNDFQLSHDFKAFGSNLLVGYFPNDSLIDTPEFLSIGRRSLLRHYFGSEWARNPHEARNSLLPNYRRFVAKSYRSCFDSGKPALDCISANIASKEQAVQHIYRRTILPVRTGGAKLFLIYCSEVA